MNWFRRLLLSSFVLMCCLVLTFSIFSFTLSQITTKENLKDFVGAIVKQQLFEGAPNAVEQSHSLLLQQCTLQESVEIPLEMQSITLSCDEVRAATKETLLPLMMGKIVDSLYYKDFSCSFVKCVETLDGTNLAFMLISNTGHLFYNQIFIAFVLVLLLIFIGIFFASEPRINALKNIGICFIITGLGYFIFLYTKELIPQTVAQELPFLDLIVSMILNNFLLVFVIGIVLVALGSFMTHKYQTLEEKINSDQQ